MLHPLGTQVPYPILRLVIFLSSQICMCTAAGHSELYYIRRACITSWVRMFVYHFTFKTSLLQLAYVL
jgi:hypothetical protein